VCASECVHVPGAGAGADEERPAFQQGVAGVCVWLALGLVSVCTCLALVRGRDRKSYAQASGCLELVTRKSPWQL
jgi:hypothetical protein